MRLPDFLTGAFLGLAYAGVGTYVGIFALGLTQHVAPWYEIVTETPGLILWLASEEVRWVMLACGIILLIAAAIWPRISTPVHRLVFMLNCFAVGIVGGIVLVHLAPRFLNPVP